MQAQITGGKIDFKGCYIQTMWKWESKTNV